VCGGCLQVWHPKGARMFREHYCVGSSHPTVETLLKHLEVESDEYDCLIPTQERAFSLAGYRGSYIQLRPYTARIIGEVYAHRAVFLLTRGRKPKDGYQVAHECAPPHYENSHCVNPDHLQERTPQENHAYMDPNLRREISILGANSEGATRTRLQPGHTPWNRGHRKQDGNTETT
jgi:hypothetical protein